MRAHGFTPELIAGLVLAGLATVVTDTARIGGETIKVELVMITDAGRRAIERSSAADRAHDLSDANDGCSAQERAGCGRRYPSKIRSRLLSRPRVSCLGVEILLLRVARS
jgi:hypothetical protein